MAKKGARQILHMICEECNTQNYISERNRDNTKDKLQLSKYCGVCRKHTIHKESSKMK
ncbi:50S ribosomal protein L33 [candidate division WWE3 bacterium CG_4_10_14_0_2_um_filter_42_7]|uniref:Large ribosomal subunit protein bL33 n=1 Tax=candidate division WWE3 bacterium CG_4_10_14_0_2_um_filter_42_7 TaxID=1975073 RepID=A0A2M7TD81_UNCKA|nr:MAG: 50S ribosomal protein L33 [candidate division WWE3 bacterium CG_4_10_14_0_2_um_filter_42_7]